MLGFTLVLCKVVIQKKFRYLPNQYIIYPFFEYYIFILFVYSKLSNIFTAVMIFPSLCLFKWLFNFLSKTPKKRWSLILSPSRGLQYFVN